MELAKAVSKFNHSLVLEPLAELPPIEEAPGSPSRGFGARAKPHALWKTHLQGIVSMRQKKDAAVDSMGCERCADPASSPRDKRFQTLVSLMLSSQTKDPITFAATSRLISAGLGSAKAMGEATETKIEELIYGVGFWHNKAKFLKLAGTACDSLYKGDVPESIEAFCSLKGVGPKMAFIAMNACWGKAVGIGVDTHVHRISNRLRWVKGSTPEQTRDHLQALLPQSMWGGINVLLVGFGQQQCLPIAPKCETCLLRKICTSSTAKGPTSFPLSKEEEVLYGRKSSVLEEEEEDVDETVDEKVDEIPVPLKAKTSKKSKK